MHALPYSVINKAKYKPNTLSMRLKGTLDAHFPQVGMII